MCCICGTPNRTYEANAHIEKDTKENIDKMLIHPHSVPTEEMSCERLKRCHLCRNKRPTIEASALETQKMIGDRNLRRSVAQGPCVQTRFVRVETHSRQCKSGTNPRLHQERCNQFHSKRGKVRRQLQLRQLNRGTDTIRASQLPEFKVAVSF